MDRLVQEHIPADNTQIDSFGTTFSALPLYLPTTSKVLLLPGNQYATLYDVYNDLYISDKRAGPLAWTYQPFNTLSSLC